MLALFHERAVRVPLTPRARFSVHLYTVHVFQAFPQLDEAHQATRRIGQFVRRAVLSEN